MSEVDLYTKIQEAAAAIQERVNIAPEVGIVLGTGLGNLASKIESATEIPVAEIPHFPNPKVVSHGGNLILGQLGGKNVVALEGRCHFYEGHTLEAITLPIRVFKSLGCDKVVLSNACGGLNPLHEKGDLLIIDDHINFMGANPLIGPNDDRLGPRFPDMCAPYDPKGIHLAEKIALEEGIRAHRGVYLALPGPCLETRAEYRMLKTWGADVVGMSTVPEVIVAVHEGLKAFGVSCITDLCLPDNLQPVSVEEIIEVAQGADPKISRIVTRLIEAWD